MNRGTIIFLNGVTSSGKSTLSKALQAAFDEPYYYVAEDMFNEVICPFAAGKGKFQDPEIMNKAVSVMYGLVREFSSKGLNVIVDNVMCGDRRFYECIDILYDYPVLFVRIDCNREELFRRANERGYKSPERLNQIDQQLELIRKRNIYDLIISTSENTENENIERIKNVLSDPERWTAFKTLKPVIDAERSSPL